MKSETVRHCWKILLILLPAFFFLIPFFIDQSLSELRDGYQAIFFGSSINGVILYFCAYKKSGTRWLTSTIVCHNVGIVYSIAQEFAAVLLLSKVWGKLEVAQKNDIFVLIGHSMAVNALSIVFVFFSIKLRKLNKKIQLRKILLNATYQALFEKIKAISDEKELDSEYGKGVQSYPEIAGHLKTTYKKRKEEISQDILV